jgi:hypothetical protein
MENEEAELLDYVALLRAVYFTGGRNLVNSEHARWIGKEIHEKYGMRGMRLVCNTLREVLGSGPARELESNWHGIGEWQR